MIAITGSKLAGYDTRKVAQEGRRTAAGSQVATRKLISELFIHVSRKVADNN